MVACTGFNLIVGVGVVVINAPSVCTRAADGIFPRRVMMLSTALSVGVFALHFLLRNLGPPRRYVVALGWGVIMLGGAGAGFGFFVSVALGVGVVVITTPSVCMRAADGIFPRRVMMLSTALLVGVFALHFLRNLRPPHRCVVVLGLASAGGEIMFGCAVFNFFVGVGVVVMTAPSVITSAADGIFPRRVMMLSTALSVGVFALHFLLRNLGPPRRYVVALGLVVAMGEMAGTY